MKEYRIIKVTYENHQSCFMIQKYKRSFLVGPKVWQYYQDVYDGNYTSHTGWTRFRILGDTFFTMKQAKETLDAIIGSSWGEVKGIEIVEEISTL